MACGSHFWGVEEEKCEKAPRGKRSAGRNKELTRNIFKILRFYALTVEVKFTLR